MYLLSVQGRYAPGFRLSRELEQKLRQQIEAVTHKHVLIISSKFRTDLLYEDDTNRLEEFLKIWCDLVGQPFTHSLKLNFFRSEEEEISLNYFFYRLQLIKRIPPWFTTYMQKLGEVMERDALNPLCRKLAESLENFRKADEKQRQRIEKETLRKSVHKFVNLKSMATSYKKNCN